jgi:hypothetical protein
MSEEMTWEEQNEPVDTKCKNLRQQIISDLYEMSCRLADKVGPVIKGDLFKE